ncbi:MAG: LamG domain-containing protein [Verrucomicrobia bacterium]|nr:LamG domain-containing protein [Verrucomicrobiota bacterium]
MRGAGVFEILVADDQPPARVEGTFELDPLGTTAEVVGSASYLGARLTGQTRISREHGLFESAGSLHIEGITNQSVVFVLEPASFDLTKSEDGTRFFRIAGQPTVPGLSAMSMILTGTLTAQGKLELRGAGSGSLGSIEFSSIHALLKRGTNILGRPDLTFKGPVNLRDTAYASLTGEIFPDGRLRNLKSDAELQLGRGIRIQPRLNDQGGVVPVLLLTGSTNNRHTFRIQGNFLTPDAGGVKPIEVDGGLILNSQGNELLLESCEATNRLPHVHWPLPDGVRLSNVWVRIALDQAEVRARMGGQLILGKPGQSLTTTLTLDAGLTINHLDLADITILDAKAFDQVTTSLTVVAWVKIPRFERTWETIIAKGDNSWRVQRAGNLNTASFDTDGVNPPYLNGSRRLDDDQWHHVAAVFDGTAKYLFVDGELDAWTPASGSIQLSTFPVWIGANADRPGRNWGGSLDEVAVFTRGLSGAEIKELYRSGGGIALQTSFSLNYPGMSGLFFRGSVASNGNFDLSSSSAGISIGGFQMGSASFRMARGGGLTQINGQGLLAVPGLPAARMAGRLLPDNTVDLRATLGSAQILALSLNNLGFILAGPISSPTLTLSGEIGVSGWGTVPLSGTVTTSGFFNLMGSPGFPSFMNFPVQAPSLTLRRQPGDYKDMVSGRSFPFQSLGDRPLAHWRLDETSGTVALDSHTRSGLGDVARNGTYSGTLLLGQPGALSGDLNSGSPSVRFDGVTTKVTVGSESTFDLRQAISVEAWIKVAAWDRPWQAIVTKGDSSWRLSRWDQGRGLAFDTNSGGIAHGTRSSKPVDDGQWHHVVAVYDGTAKYLYIDGILEAFDLYSEAIDLNDAPVMIGENAEATNRHFDGWIDEVAIYSRALQPNQVLNHYVAGGGGGLQSAFTLAIPNGIGSISVSGSMHPSGSACLVGTANNLPLPYLSLNSAVMTLARPAGAPATAIAQGNAQTPFGSSFFFGTVSSSGDYTLRTRATGSFLVGGFTLNHDAAFELKPTQLSGSGQLNFHGYSITSSLKAERSGQTTLTGGISKGFGWEMFGRTLSGAKDQPFAAASGSLDVHLDSQLNVQARFRGNFAAWHSTAYQKDVFEPPANISSMNLGLFTQVATFTQKPYTSLRVESTWDVNSDGTIEILESFQGIARYVFDLW